MYEMLRRGLFGNTLRTWDTEEEYLSSGFTGRTSLRCRKPGVTFRHGMTHEEALRVGRECFEGCEPSDFIYCESAPEWEVLFQGEVCRTERGLELSYSQERVNLREAMKAPKVAQGLVALLIVQHYLDGNDYVCLMDLLDLYPDHVVEFSLFNHSLGHLRRRLVAWEVRAY